MRTRVFTLVHSTPPRDGPAGTLVGVAEPGDELIVAGVGHFVNRGTRASPRWVRKQQEDEHG